MVGEAETRCWLGSEHKGREGQIGGEWGRQGQVLFNGAGVHKSIQLGVLAQGRRRRQWHPTPVLLPGKSHGQRSLVGCSPWGHEESDMTERLRFHFSLSLYSFMHWRRKWQPTPVFLPGESQGRVSLAQSRTRLKRLSSSSSSSSSPRKGAGSQGNRKV